MKRLFAALLALAILAIALPACAEEPALTVTQENLHVYGESTIYCYLYARVDNKTGVPMKLDKGAMNAYDADGNVVASSTSMWRYAEYLQPGEHTFVYFNPRVEGVETPDQVVKYDLEITSREDARKATFRLPQQTTFESGVTEGSWTNDYITTTVTNDADQNVFDLTIVRVLLDAKGNILYMDSDNMYTYKAITPGSSIVVRRPVNTGFKDYLYEKGYKPSAVECIAYVYATSADQYTTGGAAVVALPEAGAEAQDKTEPKSEPESEARSESAGGEAAAYVTLKKGSRGDDVLALQQRLKELGYLKGNADGDFGNGTEKAVKAFQKRAGLKQDGVAGEAVQKALFAPDAPTA